MDANTVILIKVMSDIAMRAMLILNKVDKMSEQEIADAITEAERTKRRLDDTIRNH